MRTLMLPILCVPALLAAQNPKPESELKPIITFQKTHHDFGKIGPEKKVSYRFKVTNTGKAFLNITRLSPSCGCTYTMMGKWSLAPDESTEVEVSFNPSGFRGPVRKSLQVVSDDPANPNVTLTFEADIIQDILPDTTALFVNDLLRSASRNTTLRLRSGNGKPVQVKDIKAPGAAYLSVTHRQEGNDVILDITLDGRKIPANKRMGADALSILTTSERNPRIEVAVQWSMKTIVLATPDRLAWVEPAGKAYRQTVSIKQVEGRPFHILGFRSSNPVIRVEGISKTASAQHEIAVVMGADAKAGTYNEQVILTLDDPDQPELVIRASAVLR